jgi:hypothetical protein
LKNANKFRIQAQKIISMGIYFCVICLSGCAVQKQLVPIGGSRADGTVKLGYQYGAFESPQLDAVQGINTAKQRCVAWGYNDAEAFGGYTQTCSDQTNSGCVGWNVTVEYQCKGSLEK